MTLIYALACVFVFGLVVGIIIGVPLGKKLRVNEARNNTPEAVAHIHNMLDDVHCDLDDYSEVHGEVPLAPLQRQVF